MDEDLKTRALELFEEGNIQALYELIEPFVECGDPFAINLHSCFSMLEWDESEATFAKRSIEQKIYASEHGIADASYCMGVNYLYGDDVPQDYAQARTYFERAITQGHIHSKFTFGFSIYYGTDENPVDTVRGLALMEEAAEQGSEGARKELERIRQER